MSAENRQHIISWARVSMIMAGLWNKPVSKNWLIQNVYMAYALFMKVLFIVCWFNLEGEFVRLVISGYPIGVIINGLSFAIKAVKMGVKLFIYVNNNVINMLKEVIEQERVIWALSEEAKKVYISNIWICRCYVGIIGIFSVFTCSFVTIFGGVSTVKLKRYNEAHNETLEPFFMFTNLFPRDKLANLKLTFTTQSFFAWNAFNYGSVTQIILITLLVYSISRLEILQVKLRTYIEADFSEDPSEKEVKEKVMIMKSLVHEHQDIIRFIEQLSESTKYTLMADFVLSSIDLSALTVNIIKMDFSQLPWQLAFLVLLLGEIYIFAWICNEIKVQSEAIADAVYESRWYLLNKELKQLSLIMLTRAQRPLLMTIGPFGPMTTNSAVLVSKAAYSYVSLMRE